jgi:hypothetical protein
MAKKLCKMKQLTKEAAKNILSWYDSIGANNWGGWHSYPSIGTDASYASFEDCHLRIMLDETMQMDGADDNFNCISDSRRVPGKKVKGIASIQDLRDYVLTADEKNEKLKEAWVSDWSRAKKMQADQLAFEGQSDEEKSVIADINGKIAAIAGTPNSKKPKIELEKLLLPYKLPAIPFAGWAGHWMEKAASFATSEEYIAYMSKSAR